MNRTALVVAMSLAGAFSLAQIAHHHGLSGHSNLSDVSQATIVNSWWKDQVPADVKDPLSSVMPHDGDLIIELAHQGKGDFYVPMRRFMQGVDRHFVLRNGLAPELRLTASEGTLSFSSRDNGGSDRTFVELTLDPGQQGKVHHGASYSLKPLNSASGHAWHLAAPMQVVVP